MKAKNLIIIFFCIILSAFILGATGIIKVTNEAAQENPGPDRLIGVLITNEYPDWSDQEKLYASLVKTDPTNDQTGKTAAGKEYAFTDIDGIRFFAPFIREESGSYWDACTDEGITDVDQFLQSTETGENMSLKGTLFVSSHSSLGHFYFNPVYQTTNGEVYAVSGNGMFFDDESVPGVSQTTKISENQKATSGDTTTASGTEVEVTVSFMDAPTNIALLQFNSKNELLARTEYRPGTLPEHIDVLSDTQYIIMETSSPEGLERTLFQQDDDFADAFYCRSDGICVKQECEIGWNH